MGALACGILGIMTVVKKSKSVLLAYGLLIAWALVIFYLSSEGSDASSGRSDVIVQTVQSWGVATTGTDFMTFLVRKSAHIIAYFIFGGLAYNVIRHYKLPVRRALLASGAIVLVYALSDEFHQLFVPGRSGELRDVVIDTAAGVMGVCLAYLIHRKYVRIKAKRRVT